MADGKIKRIRELNSKGAGMVKTTTNEKISDIKEDRRNLAILCIEFVLVVLIALIIYFYLDPETSVVVFPYSILLFALFGVAVFWVYHWTSHFRTEIKQ